MANNTETLNRSLYDLLRSKGYRPKMLTTAGDTVPVPEEAAVFLFNFIKDGKDYGQVSVSIDGAKKLIVYFDDEVADSPDTNTSGTKISDSWSSLLRHLSQWRFSKGLRKFETRNQDHLEADMAQREYMHKKENVSEGYHAMGKKASYNDNIPECKIVIQHSRQIEEGEQRYRNIARIFLENSLGERILAPTTKPGVAQVYARHIAEGGVPNDERWNHIKGLCEEYNQMAGFVRATRNGQFNESAQQLVTEGINHYQKLRESLGKMRTHRGYNAYFESYTPSLMEDESTVDLSEMFMTASLDPRIESVMPILSKLHKTVSEMKEVDALAEWADNLLEGGDGGEASEETDGDTDGEAGEGGAEDADDLEDLDEAAGAETLAHNERTVNSNLDAFDLDEGDGGQEALNAVGIPEDVDTGEYDARKSVKSEPKGDWDKDFREKLKQYTKELEQRQKEEKEVDEGLDADQKRVGQLGPTEKVKNNNIGKLVGANENFINTDAQAVVTEQGEANLAKALDTLSGSWSGWHQVDSYEPNIEKYEWDDGEGGFYAGGSIEHNLKTGEITVDFADEYGEEVKGTFNTVGAAMNALRGNYPASHGGKAPKHDTLANKTLAGPDDLYKTDRAGKKGTLTKARMDGMKASSPYTMRGGPKGVLPEGQEDLDAIKRLLGK